MVQQIADQTTQTVICAPLCNVKVSTKAESLFPTLRERFCGTDIAMYRVHVVPCGTIVSKIEWRDKTSVLICRIPWEN